MVKGIIRRLKVIINGFLGRGRFPHQLSFILDIPFRRLILSPEKLADRLHLKEDSHVLEIGPGSGFFSVEVAKRVPHGLLILLDIEKKMLKKTRRKIEKADLYNAVYVCADCRYPPIAKNKVDVVFLVAVLGEVPDPATGLESIFKILKPGGLLSITEQPGDPDLQPIDVVRKLAEDQNFLFIEAYGKNKNYTANFKKPS